MLLSAVVAVALGVAPIDQATPAQTVSGDYTSQVGKFSQRVDRRGTTHVRGVDRRGSSYDITLDRHGYVEATVGDSPDPLADVVLRLSQPGEQFQIPFLERRRVFPPACA